MSPVDEKPQGAGADQDEELDISKLDGNKIAQLMKRDPKFISRLISDLDKSMHKMLGEREKRKQRIDTNLKEMNKIQGEIDAHILPNMANLKHELELKREVRERIKKQIAHQGTTFSKLEREAAALVRKATHSSKGIMRKVASNSLQETRGYRADIPTTTLTEGSKKTKE